MINIKIDISGLVNKINELKVLKERLPDITRELATSLIPIIKERIHGEGKAADNSQTGSYSERYLKRRAKKYGTSDKVILSDTRNLQNSYVVVRDDNGMYGIGVIDQKEKGNIGNVELIQILEEKYQKVIFGLTDQEREQAIKFIQFKINEALNDK